MRGLPLAPRGAPVLLGLLLLGASPSSGEPLLLHIRPNDASAADAAKTGGRTGDVELAAARAAREAVWERSDRRARIAIASVCTDCMKAPPAEAAMPNAPTPAAATAVPPSAAPTPTEPVLALAATQATP